MRVPRFKLQTLMLARRSVCVFDAVPSLSFSGRVRILGGLPIFVVVLFEMRLVTGETENVVASIAPYLWIGYSR